MHKHRSSFDDIVENWFSLFKPADEVIFTIIYASLARATTNDTLESKIQYGGLTARIDFPLFSENKGSHAVSGVLIGRDGRDNLKGPELLVQGIERPWEKEGLIMREKKVIIYAKIRTKRNVA